MEMQRARARSSPVEPVYLFGLLISILAGVFFLFITGLPRKWFLLLFGATVLFAVSPRSGGDTKKFYLVLLILALPFGLSKTFMFTPTPIYRSDFGFTVPASFGPLFILYLIWIYRKMFSEESASLPISARGLPSFAGLFVMSAISGLLTARGSWPFFSLFSLSCAGILFTYMASEMRKTADIKLVMKVLIAIGTFEGILGIGQYLTGSDLGFRFAGPGQFLTGYVGLLEVSRVMGTIGHPNQLAMLFDLLLPITFAFLMFYPMQSWKRALTLFAVFFQYLGLALTLSRGGLTYSSLAMAALLFIYLRRRMNAFRGIAIFLFLIMSFTVLVLVVPNPVQRAIFRAEGAGTAAGRIPLDKVALDVIKARPFFGIGLNAYVQNVAQYDTTPEQLNMDWNSPVHNLFLFIAGEIGILGLLFFLSLLWTVLRPLPRIFGADNPVLACSAMGMFMGILAFMAHNMVDLTDWTHPTLIWSILGLAVSIWRLSLDPEPVQQPAWKTTAGRGPFKNGRPPEAERFCSHGD